MKSKMFQEMIGNIDDDLIVAADVRVVPMKKKSVFKWASVAAAACLVLVCAFTIAPKLTNTIPSTENANGNKESGQEGEMCLEGWYKYVVDEGQFTTYEMGKAINVSKVGQKIEDVTVTAGWYHYIDDIWDANEHARAEIYEIKGVSPDTAVAIKFLDKLEAEEIELYYVIINPEADNTPVKNYVIVYGNPAEQDGGIVLE